MIALILLCLVMLSGCTNTGREPVERLVIQTKYQPLTLDHWITNPVEPPKLNGEKWLDLSEFALDYAQALEQCNLQLDAARAASEQAKQHAKP